MIPTVAKVGVTMLWVVVSVSLNAFYVVAPVSPSGCVLVVGESLIGHEYSSGDVYVVAPGSHRLQHAFRAWSFANNTWIDRNTWSLSWSGDTGTLHYQETDVQITCLT